MNNETIFNFTAEIFSHDLHVKRGSSLSNAVTGVIKNGSLAVHLIGKGMEQAKGLDNKHAIKQVDRLLSNDSINLKDLFPGWIKHIIGKMIILLPLWIGLILIVITTRHY